MATTINSYSVGLSLDAGSYIRNSSLSRKETNALKREIGQARTPAENFERSINRLDKALKEGAIDQRTYNRLVESSASKMKQATSASDRLTSSLKTMAASYVGISMLNSAFDSIKQRMLDIDEIAKSSRAIGESFNRMQAFRFAVGEFTGIDGPAAQTMLTKLTQRIGEASIGFGEAANTFKMLNLNVKDLVSLSPVQQFEATADAIRKIKNPTEQVAFATKLFEESGAKLLPLMRATTEAYKESTSQIERLGLAMDDVRVNQIEKTNDALGRLAAAGTGLRQSFLGMKVVTDQLDILTEKTASLTKVMNEGKGLSSFFKSMFLTDGQFGFEAGKKFFNESIDTNRKPIPGMGDRATDTTAFADAGKHIGEAVKSVLVGKESIGSTYTKPDWATSLSEEMRGNTFRLMGAQWAQTAEIVNAQKESPAIKAMEANSQEAYEFITGATKRQQEKEAEQKAREEKAEKQREQSNRLMQTFVDLLKEQGWGAI